MPDFAATKATLRICGDDLDPDVITSKLGVAPTSAHRKGETTKHGHSATTGVWSLSDTTDAATLEEKILNLLSLTSADERDWLAIAGKWRVDMFCGVFMRESNEGTEISPSTLAELARRHIVLGLDVYFSGEEN